MDSRRRGAVLLLAALVVGRVLDRFDLAFENVSSRAGEPPAATEPRPASVDASPAEPVSLDPLRPGPVSKDPHRPEPGSTDPLAVRSDAAVEPAPVLPLSINHATALELQRLPGVGPVLAGRIVAERESGGRFGDPADLCRVKGIGPATSARLAPHLRFD